jgi:ribosomal protein S12 methylthiotransferase accessory factor
MEAVECAHAETIDRPLVFASRRELARSRCVIPLEGLPRTLGSQIDDYARLLWIEGFDLQDGAPVMVPYELVHAHFAPPHLPNSDGFLATTNGLASGNALAEAIAHGLFETIERDALALWAPLPAAKRNAALLEVDRGAEPAVGDTLERLAHAGFRVALWDITSEIGVPAFHAMIVDGREPEGHPGTGTGCHPDKNVALARALFEAVQVRATYISGGRDDLSRREYERSHLDSFRLTLESDSGRERKAFSELPTTFSDCLEDDLRHTLDRLRRAGGYRAIVVDLSHPDSGIAVARVLVPGLEGPLGDNAAPGKRALEARQ